MAWIATSAVETVAGSRSLPGAGWGAKLCDGRAEPMPPM